MEKQVGFIKPSTRRFFKESKKLGRYGFIDWLHGYVYGRWAYFYIGIGTGEHTLVKRFRPLGAAVCRVFNLVTGLGRKKDQHDGVSFADTYHGKVVPLENARKLVTLDRPIELPNLEKIIPYKRARDLILHNPNHIVALDCPCRSVRENPCMPLDVCLIIGEPFASFMFDHHGPHKARAITQQEALDILEQENKRGHVAHAFFKDVMLDRFYAICNCCSCCCGAMQAQRRGTPMLASSGFVCRLDEKKCVSCGDCVSVCQFSAIDMDSEQRIDEQACMGCGVCVNFCPQEALLLVRDPSRGEPLEIHRLMEEYGDRAMAEQDVQQ
ncbi:MAG: 4Fe-4S binding protein [Desulfofustis sp.]|nr:4Fe-4S binding protein [Desulfofustis sp.]NNK56731.1 4Fe-4S binding protein [Desulfofustis sp.]